MMIHYNQRRRDTTTSGDRDSAGLDAGAVIEPIDPDRFFDDLPQPYRLINKIIESIISNACDQVDSAVMARARSMRLSKQQLADLSCLEYVGEEFELAKTNTALFPIGGSLLIFFTNESNLVLWDSSEMAQLDSLYMAEQTLLKVDSYELSPTRFLVVVLTLKNPSTSMMTIVGVLNSKLHILTQQEVGTQETVVSDCIISPRSDFLAITYSAIDEFRCVEIFSMQGDAWFRTLEAALLSAVIAARPLSPGSGQAPGVPGVPGSVTSEAPSLDNASTAPSSIMAPSHASQHAGTSTGHAPSVAGSVGNAAASLGHAQSNAGSTSNVSVPAGGSVAGTNASAPAGTSIAGSQINAPSNTTAPSVQFAEADRPRIPSCSLTIRFKYPVLSPSLTLNQFIKSSEAADGLCLGLNHVLSPNFISIKQALHKSRQASVMPAGIADRLVVPVTVPTKKAPHCAWLTDTKCVVAWPEVSALVVYSAIKAPPAQGKSTTQANAVIDQIEGRPESSWPLSSPVLAMSLSYCRRIVGVLLEGGTILVLNSGNFTATSNAFSWMVSATLSLVPAPSVPRKFSVIQTDRILLETFGVLPATANNYAALVRYQEASACMNVAWKFNSLDIGSDFAFVEVFEQWPSIVFLGLPDGALLLCERDAFSKRLTQLRLPAGYVWPTPSKDCDPILRLTSDGRILFALAHFEAPLIATDSTSTTDQSNKLFRFDLVSNLPANLVSRWNPTAVTVGRNLSAASNNKVTTTTAIANQLIKQSVCSSADTTERLKKLWAEERDRNKDSRS